MKHTFIKKSIVFTICTLLLFSTLSFAAVGISCDDITITSTDYNLTAVDIVDFYPIDPDVDLYRAVYHVQFIPIVTQNVYNKGNYINGSFLLPITCSITGANVSVIDFNIQSNNIINETAFSEIDWNVNGNSLAFRLYGAYCNHYVVPSGGRRLPAATVDITIITNYQGNGTPAGISVSFSSVDVAGHVYCNEYPDTTKGLSAIITASILSGLDNSLTAADIGAILIYAAGNNQLLSEILHELYSANINMEDIYTYLSSTQNQKLTTVINKLQEIIDMNKNDTQAANELSQAAQQMENAAAAMNVTKPNMAAVIPQTLVDDDAVAAQGTIFSWLNNSYIIAILSAMMTIALIGFVIYGKSG